MKLFDFVKMNSILQNSFGTIDSINMNIDLNRIEFKYEIELVLKSGKDLCLRVSFKPDKFYVIQLKGGYKCPTGKSMMNSLISYARNIECYSGSLDDYSEFNISGQVDKIMINSKIKNVIDWGYDCGENAFSYYSQFGFKYSPEENNRIKEAETYFKNLKLNDFINNLNKKTSIYGTWINRSQEFQSENINLRQFLRNIKEKNLIDYYRLISIFSEGSARYSLTKETQLNLEILSKGYKMKIDISQENAVTCKKE